MTMNTFFRKARADETDTILSLYLLYIYRSALQGMGYTRTAMISGLIEFVMRVGLALVVVFTRFANGLFLAEVAAWLGAAVFLCIFYYIRRPRLN